MPATIEHLVSLLRIGAKTNTYGDPYEFAVTVRWLSPSTVELLGFSRTGEGRFLPSHFKAIREALVSAGAEEAVWTRKNTPTKRQRVALGYPRACKP